MNELRRSTKAIEVTPSDTVDLPTGGAICIGFYVGGAGNVVVVNRDDTTAIFTAVPAGGTRPSDAKRINATGTTATNIVAFLG
jgi:hypothetical protein